MLNGLTQTQAGIDTLQIAFTNRIPTQVSITRDAEAGFAVWPGGALSQYYTRVSGGLEFLLSLVVLSLGTHTITVTATYADGYTNLENYINSLT